MLIHWPPNPTNAEDLCQSENDIPMARAGRRCRYPLFCSSKTSLSFIRRNYMGSTCKCPTAITLASLALRWAQKACMGNTITGLRFSAASRFTGVSEYLGRFRSTLVQTCLGHSRISRFQGGKGPCWQSGMYRGSAPLGCCIHRHTSARTLAEISTFDEKVANTGRQLL